MNIYVYVAITSVFFGIWPVFARFASLSPSMLSLFVSIATGVVSMIGLQFESSTIEITTKSICIGFGVGILNGIGLITYSKLIGWREGVELSVVLPTISALIPVVAVIGAILLFGEVITIKKFCGLMLVPISIYLLNS